jgi:hypothetical protein
VGTNFYLYPDKPLLVKVADKLREHKDQGIHIGKRSAAGTFCWDCNITLHKKGNDGIHHGCRTPGHIACDCDWHETCPRCGKKRKKESLSESAAGRELGFDKSKPKRKKGVSTCCSFRWAMSKVSLDDYLSRGYKIKNEYGDYFTESGFKHEVLEECPVQYFDMIGQEFS